MMGSRTGNCRWWTFVLPAAAAISCGAPEKPAPVPQPKVEVKAKPVNAGWVVCLEDTYDDVAVLYDGKNVLSPAEVVCIRAAARRWDGDSGKVEDGLAGTALLSWAKSGARRVALRIDCRTEGSLPDRLRGKVALLPTKDRAPQYWDAEYLDHHQKLVNALAQRLAPHAAQVAFVVITGAEWQAAEEWKDFGLDDAGEQLLVKRYVDLYLSAFPKDKFPETRLYLPYQAIARNNKFSGDLLAYLKQHGIGLADDGRRDFTPPLASWISASRVNIADFPMLLGEGYFEAQFPAGNDARYIGLLESLNAHHCVLSPVNHPNGIRLLGNDHGARLRKIGAAMGSRAKPV